MRTDPLWFVFKMKQAQIREIEMYMKPLEGILGTTEPPLKHKKFDFPEHLRRNKKK